MDGDEPDLGRNRRGQGHARSPSSSLRSDAHSDATTLRDHRAASSSCSRIQLPAASSSKPPAAMNAARRRLVDPAIASRSSIPNGPETSPRLWAWWPRPTASMPASWPSSPKRSSRPPRKNPRKTGRNPATRRPPTTTHRPPNHGVQSLEMTEPKAAKKSIQAVIRLLDRNPRASKKAIESLVESDDEWRQRLSSSNRCRASAASPPPPSSPTSLKSESSTDSKSPP